MSRSAATKKKYNYWLYDFTKITAALPGMITVRPKVYYENENAKKRIKGGALLISNHIGLIDPLALMCVIWYRRHHFLCIKELFEKPKIGWMFKGFHCIPIDRENFGMDTLRDIVGHLKDDELVSMFPEGHVVVDNGGEIDAFKSGMVLMSVMSKKPIVPVYMESGKKFFSRYYAIIGQPIDIYSKYGAMPSLSDIEEITKEIRTQEDRLRTMLNERRNKK